MAAGRGVERVLAKLQVSVEAGDYYEAHQMYRTLYFRYKNQNKFVEAINLLYSGATTLLGHNQHTSGSDLALLLVEAYNASCSQPTEDDFEKLGNLHRLIEPDSPDRVPYTGAALKWTTVTNKEHRTGHPALHQKFAITLWKEKNYAQSRYHFMHSTDGENCATMLVEYHITLGYPSEVDLFIGQAVLQYLCLRNITTATTTFNKYTQHHPQIEEGPPFIRPLLNFLWFLLLAIESGKVAVFSVLCEHYQPAIQRDPTYIEYLDRIGQLFFGMPRPKAAQPNIFGNLIQSLLGMDDDESETDGELLQATTSNHTPVMATEELD